MLNSVHPPPPLLFSVVGDERPTKFSKRRGGGGGVVDRISLFIAGKVGAVAFFKGGCSFDIKNKLKSEIFNDKKSL